MTTPCSIFYRRGPAGEHRSQVVGGTWKLTPARGRVLPSGGQNSNAVDTGCQQ